MRIEVTYLGITTEITQMEYSFERGIRINGKPATQVFFNGFNFILGSSPAGLRFMEEMLRLNEQLKNPNKADPLETDFYKTLYC